MKFWLMKSYCFMLSSLMLMNKNHMLILVNIVSYCLAVSCIIFLKTTNYWVVMMIIFVYVSGVMVLFMYIISLAPNEKSKVNKYKPYMLMFLISLPLISSMIKNSNNSFQSSYKNNLTIMVIVTTMVMVSAYIPPMMLMLFYKGMKSSK